MQALLALSGHTRPYSVKRTAYLRHLASFFLQLADDPALVPVIARWFEGERRWIAERLTDALAAGALRPDTPVSDLARTLQAALNGARFQWATGGKGTESTWSRREMEAVLAPWRAPILRIAATRSASSTESSRAEAKLRRAGRARSSGRSSTGISSANRCSQ